MINFFSKKNNKNQQIALRRRLFNYSKIFKWCLKLVILISLLLFIFTDIFEDERSDIINNFYLKSAKFGFNIEDVNIIGRKYSSIYKINNVIYDNIVNMNSDEIEGKDSDILKPIFALNLSDVQKQINDLRWVKNSIVKRKLPNKLIIYIEEKTPVAIWQNDNNKLCLIDKKSECITDEITSHQDFQKLPHLIGKNANIYYADFLNKINKNKQFVQKISSAVYISSRRWNLNIGDNLVVKMPENNFDAAYEYLCLLNKHQDIEKTYQLIDLRIKNKYYLIPLSNINASGVNNKIYSN